MEALIPTILLDRWAGYLLFEFVDDAHLVPRFGTADLSDGVLGLSGVVMVVAAHLCLNIS